MERHPIEEYKEDVTIADTLLEGNEFAELRQDVWLSCPTCGNIALDEVEQLDYSASSGRVRFRCFGCNVIQESPLYE